MARHRQSARMTDRLYKHITADLLAESGVAPTVRPACPRCGVTAHRRLDGQCRMADIIRHVNH